MKNKFIYSALLLVLLNFSCSNDDSPEIEATNENSVTNCDLTIKPETAVAICVDGADFALPDEILTFASTFYSRGDTASNSTFVWTIESGSLEVLSIENSVDGQIAKSVATIKFNSDYSGNGVVKVDADNDSGRGFATQSIELDSN
ncbi:hypothetical protein H0I23_02830 [Cellulophaga sp. HaHaR_3_176]|uniref:hypothetical protein n=1 Tax=Cellulophaga sp. HaHaR_3_176 TaxID=1942464 RepID=UPI001C1FDE7D|nr:hypothetical protein [Cellulophaga sp. HaHaR_3_176]QWX84598.1 hypothetical protein H0I23_02830 [Cellulophaga sp. HaHaR_3_176]